jgi:hypothetical protein
MRTDWLWSQHKAVFDAFCCRQSSQAQAVLKFNHEASLKPSPGAAYRSSFSQHRPACMRKRKQGVISFVISVCKQLAPATLLG